MATLAHQNLYLILDTLDISTHVIAVEYESLHDLIDVTAGAQASYRQYVAGMARMRFSMTINYDISAAPVVLTALRPGQLVWIDYGIEGSASGKPRDRGQYLVTRVQVKRDRAKSLVSFVVETISADAPLDNAMLGATF